MGVEIEIRGTSREDKTGLRDPPTCHENDGERPLEGVTVRTAKGAAIGASH